MRKIIIAYNANPEKDMQKTGVPYFVKMLFSELKKNKENGFIKIYPNPFSKAKISLINKMLQKLNSVYARIILPLYLKFKKVDVYIETEINYRPLIKTEYLKINMIYDIGMILFDNIQLEHVQEMYRTIMAESINNVDLVITLSNTSKNDIQNYMLKNGKNIYIDYIYCNTTILEAEEENFLEIKEKFNISEKYILFIGTLEPRKNPINMVKGYHYYIKKYKSDVKLVIAGKKGWLYDDVLNYIEENNLENNIIFTGFIDDNEKYHLLKNCEFFIFLSLYEGFGIPPLEALKLGKKVLLSDIPVFNELFSGNVMFTNHLDSVDIGESIYKIINSDIKVNLDNLKRFSWELSAKKLELIINENLKGKYK